MEERGFTFDNNNIYKPERQLMATDIDALIKESTSDEFIEKKINNVLGCDVELKEE